MDDLQQLKERMKEFWALGDYPQVAKRFELRERFVELIGEWNRGHDGSVRLPAAYLLVVARRTA